MFENHLVPFLEFLRQNRYAPCSIRLARTVSTEFCLYVAGRVDRADQVTADHLRAFLDIRARIFPHRWRRPMLPHYRRRLADALRLFLRYLGSRGVHTSIRLRCNRDLRAVPGYEKLLIDYESYLRRHRGLAETTIYAYLDHASRLCAAMARRRLRRWDDLTPRALYAHLRGQAQSLGHLSLRHAQTAVRSFFRYLRLTRRCTRPLDRYLIRVRSYGLSRVPKTLSVAQLEKIFSDVRGDSPSDVRDRAVLLLLTLYGLRIGEIVRLRLEDVQWRHQQLIVRRRKSGRDLMLPLHPAVGKSLLQYVQQVRPAGTPFREIFLTRRTPHPYPRGSNLGMTLRERLIRLGVHTNIHAFRHTLGSRLINNDCPPAWIQILLGHQDFRSTQIYTKVDLDHLKEVADNDGARL